MSKGFMCPPSASDEASSGKQGSRSHPVAMSPEERAEHFLRNDHSRTRPECKAAIAAMIRAAECAALERAYAAAVNVRTFEWKGGDEWAAGFVDGKNEAALAIEHLKHSDRVSEKTPLSRGEAQASTEGTQKSPPHG